jgi:hypothetical protein
MPLEAALVKYHGSPLRSERLMTIYVQLLVHLCVQSSDLLIVAENLRRAKAANYVSVCDNLPFFIKLVG